MFKSKIVIIFLFLILIFNHINLEKNPNRFYKLKTIQNYKDMSFYIDYKELIDENNKLKELLNINKTDTKLINATVINRNIGNWYKYLIIDKGNVDGIEKNMATITDKCLIGKVVNTTDKTSLIKLITNSKVSVKINNIYALLEEYDGNYFKITNITSNEQISIGDEVFTSGLSDLYPGGIKIGKVVDIKKDNYDLSRILLVESNCNLDDIKYVGLIKVVK